MGRDFEEFMEGFSSTFKPGDFIGARIKKKRMEAEKVAELRDKARRDLLESQSEFDSLRKTLPEDIGGMYQKELDVISSSTDPLSVYKDSPLSGVIETQLKGRIKGRNEADVKTVLDKEIVGVRKKGWDIDPLLKMEEYAGAAPEDQLEMVGQFKTAQEDKYIKEYETDLSGGVNKISSIMSENIDDKRKQIKFKTVLKALLLKHQGKSAEINRVLNMLYPEYMPKNIDTKDQNADLMKFLGEMRR